MLSLPLCELGLWVVTHSGHEICLPFFVFVLSCVDMVEALQRTDTPRNESYQTAREKKNKFEKRIWRSSTAISCTKNIE